MTSVMPMEPGAGAGVGDWLDDADQNPERDWLDDADQNPERTLDNAQIDVTALRVNLTRPHDRDNELIKVAAVHGPSGILAVLRSHRDYGWFVVLGLKAIEVCLSPRGPKPQPQVLKDCDPVMFTMRMLETEMLDEVFELIRRYDHLRDAQRTGMAIIELLVMDDQDWRDEVARKGGVALLCEIAKQRKDSPKLMCQVMTCMSYLAAEDYIEIMLCQHDALEFVAYCFEKHTRNAELVTRTSLALLNLTACEPHVEELMDKGALPSVLQAFEAHAGDPHVAIILCGVLANFSVNDQARQLLVEEGVLELIGAAMRLDSDNAVLQVACLKAMVNYSLNADHYAKMEVAGIPSLVATAMSTHPTDHGVQSYGNYFQGQYVSCTIM